MRFYSYSYHTSFRRRKPRTDRTEGRETWRSDGKRRPATSVSSAHERTRMRLSRASHLAALVCLAALVTAQTELTDERTTPRRGSCAGACDACWFASSDASVVECCCEPSCEQVGDCCDDYRATCVRSSGGEAPTRAPEPSADDDHENPTKGGTDATGDEEKTPPPPLPGLPSAPRRTPGPSFAIVPAAATASNDDDGETSGAPEALAPEPVEDTTGEIMTSPPPPPPPSPPTIPSDPPPAPPSSPPLPVPRPSAPIPPPRSVRDRISDLPAASVDVSGGGGRESVGEERFPSAAFWRAVGAALGIDTSGKPLSAANTERPGRVGGGTAARPSESRDAEPRETFASTRTEDCRK